MQVVRKAVFPVAGLGTRFLPATKAIPKEVLPLVDKPLIQYAIDEARAAGITDFIFVTAKGKSALEDYFDGSPELVRSLCAKNKQDLLEAIKPSEMASGAISYIRQQEALGLGHAVWCARHLVGDEPFAVILPDDVIAAETPCLIQMMEAYAEVGGNVIAAMDVPTEDTPSYGIIDPASQSGSLISARGVVEKPTEADAPSRLAIIGRYILTPHVMGSLDQMLQDNHGSDNKVQLTDAIATEIASGRDVHGYQFDGDRYDCGSKAGFLQATVAFALARPELREEFAAYINETVKALHATK